MKKNLFTVFSFLLGCLTSFNSSAHLVDKNAETGIQMGTGIVVEYDDQGLISACKTKAHRPEFVGEVKSMGLPSANANFLKDCDVEKQTEFYDASSEISIVGNDGCSLRR